MELFDIPRMEHTFHSCGECLAGSQQIEERERQESITDLELKEFYIVITRWMRNFGFTDLAFSINYSSKKLEIIHKSKRHGEKSLSRIAFDFTPRWSEGTPIDEIRKIARCLVIEFLCNSFSSHVFYDDYFHEVWGKFADRLLGVLTKIDSGEIQSLAKELS